MSPTPPLEAKTKVSSPDDKITQDGLGQIGTIVPDSESGPSPVPLRTQPPNQGLRAWLTVLAGFFIYLNTWGVTSSYGAFQTFYESSLLPTTSPSTIAWIGSIQSFLVVIVGVIAGPLFDKGYLQHLIFLGCFLIVFGTMMLSLANTYYQIFLAQGVCIGLGAGLIFIPALALISSQFTTKRPIALGVASSGSAVGGVIFPIMFRKLQPAIGFPWTVRCLAFISFGTLLIVLLILVKHKTPKPSQTRRLIDPRAFTETPFLLLSLALFFVFISFYVPLFYIPSYATFKLHTSDDFAFYLLAIANAGSFFGRTTPYLLSRYIGPIEIFTFWAFVAVVLLFAWIGILNVPGFVVFSALWGYVSGVLVTAPIAVVAHPIISPSLSVIGLRLGMCWSMAAVGILVGSPIVGALVDLKAAKFVAAQAFAAAMMAVGSICLIWPLVTILRYRPPVER